MDDKTIQPMDLLLRDEARDIERIRETLNNFVDHVPVYLQSGYAQECNPNIDVYVDNYINTEGIENELASIGTELIGLNSLQREAIEVNQDGFATLNSLQREAIETARSGFNDISSALQGIKKIGALWLLDKSLLNPEAYLGKYRELILNNIIPSPAELAVMLSQGHVYMKLYALAEMGTQKVYNSELVMSLGSANYLIAGYAGYALQQVNPPLVKKGQTLRADGGYYSYFAPVNSPEYDAFSMLLSSNNLITRSRAAKVLGGLSDGVVFWPQLFEMSRNDYESEMVQRSAARSLLRFGRKILPDLEKRLKSLSQNDSKLERAHVKILRDNILQKYVQSPPSYLEVYRNDILGDVIPPPDSLIKLVQKGNYYEKLYALAELGAQKRYDNALVAAISSKNKKVVEYAWYALSQIQPLIFSKGMTFIIPDNYQNLQGQGYVRKLYPDLYYYGYGPVSILPNKKCVALANSPAFDALTTLLQNKNANVRGRAACVLGELPGGHTAYWELLRVYCYDPEKEVRAEAALSLRAFGTKIIEQLDHIITVGGVDLRLYRGVKKIRTKIKSE